MSRQRIKILFVVGGGRFFGAALPLGGAASYLRAAALSLPPERFEAVFVFLFHGPTVLEFSKLGFECRVVEGFFRGDPTLPLRLARIMKDEDPDAVVTAVSNANLYGRIAAKLAGVGALFTIVMDFMDGIMGTRRAAPLLETLALRQEKLLWPMNTALVAVSNPLREKIIDEWGVPAERVIVIPGVVAADEVAVDPVDIAALRRELGVGAGQILAGTICRITLVKNLAMLLRAARRVEKDAPGLVKFVVAGDGPLRQDLEAESRRMGLEKVVRFVGWCEKGRTFAAAADLHLLTSFSEAQGISLLEAMAASRTVVATAVGGVKEVVADGETGFLVDPDDDEAMARSIVELARNPDLAAQMGAAGRARLESRFSPARARQGFEALPDLVHSKHG